MKIIISFLGSYLLFVCPILMGQTYTLPGYLTLQNSGNQPVIGAEILAVWADPALSDENGAFQLSFVGKQAGYEAIIQIKKTGYEVVNKEELFHTLTAGQRPVTFYLCPEGQWESNALAYYEINQEHLTRRYREEIARVKRNLANQESMMLDSLDRLERRYLSALSQIQNFAETFAKANLDDVSDLYESAFERFSMGDIEAAIDMLSDDKLENQQQRIEAEIRAGQKLIAIGKEKEVVAEEAIEQGIKDYLLKADLLVIDFRLDEVDGNFEKAVAANPDRYETRIRYGQFLSKQERYEAAINQYTIGLSLTDAPEPQGVFCSNICHVSILLNQFDQAIVYGTQAQTIFQHLSDENPSLYLPKLLNSSVTLAMAQVIGLRSYEAGLENLTHLLQAYRNMEDKDDETMLDFANTLGNLGRIFNDRNSYSEAAKYLIESVNTLYELSQGKSETDPIFEEIAVGLTNLGISLIGSDAYQEGISVYEEALTINETLASKNEEAFLSDIGIVCINLGIVYFDLNRFDKCEPLYLRGIDIFEKLSERNPQAHLGNLALVLANLGQLYSYQDSFYRSIELIERAIDIQTRLLEQDSMFYQQAMLNSNNYLSRAWFMLDSFQLAERYVSQGYRIAKKLNEQFQGRFAHEHAGAADNWGVCLTNLNKARAAIPKHREALTIYHSLFEEDSVSFAGELSSCYKNLTLAFQYAGDRDSTVKYFQQSLALNKALSQQNWDKYGIEYAKSLTLGVFIYGFNPFIAAKYVMDAEDALDRCPDTPESRNARRMLEEYPPLKMFPRTKKKK